MRIAEFRALWRWARLFVLSCLGDAWPITTRCSSGTACARPTATDLQGKARPAPRPCGDPKAMPGASDFRAQGPLARGGADAARVRRAAARRHNRFPPSAWRWRRRTTASARSGCGSPANLGPRGLRVDCGYGMRSRLPARCGGVWAGVAWWSARCACGAPVLPPGKSSAAGAPWAHPNQPRAWGGNYSVPDFSAGVPQRRRVRLYAHYGVNGMMIYGDVLCYADSTILPELNHPTQEACGHPGRCARRAARYGVRFTYYLSGPKLASQSSGVPQSSRGRRRPGLAGRRSPFLCSSSETTLKFYEELSATFSAR